MTEQAEKRTGVIVGRFQEAALTAGHRHLFEHVARRSSRVIVLLGCPPSIGTKRDPLEYNLRINEKGYKVLDPHVLVIQGDGCSLDTIEEVLHQMTFQGYSTDNITFGMGGWLLQKCDRDTQKFAVKCSSVMVDGMERDVWKSPTGDIGKHSKRGQLSLIRTEAGEFKTVRRETLKDSGRVDMLQEVFRDGKVLRPQSLALIRARAAIVVPEAVQEPVGAS